MIHWDEEVNLICVGSGIAGCAAAIAAAEGGLKVVVLEKSPKLGGTTTWSLGIVWVGNGHLARASGVTDSAAETRAYLDYLGGGRNDPEITQSFVDHAPEALHFFEKVAQVPFYLVEKLPDHYYPAGEGSRPFGRSHQVRAFEASSLGNLQKNLDLTPYRHGRVTFEEMAARGGMAGQWDRELLAQREAKDIRTFGGALAGYFLKSVIDRQIPIRTEAQISRLIIDQDRVVGAEISSPGATTTMRASRGVVLATGQYDSNPRLMGLFDEFNSWPPRGAPRNQGDGLILAAEHGAALKVMHWNLTILLGYHVKGESVDGQPLMRGAGSREVAYPHCIIVNRDGKRFADESSFGEVAAKLREFNVWTHRPVNVPCYLIFDAQYWAKYGLQPFAPASEPPEWIESAETVRELAHRLAIDPEGLSETVERFNRFAAAGTDRDFQRGRMPWSQQASGDLNQKNANMGSLDQPPFYAIELKPISGHSVGLLTNSSGQVIHLRGHAIDGLYACGDVAASLHVGVGYQAGLNLAGGMTFGFMAAQHAARKSPP